VSEKSKQFVPDDEANSFHKLQPRPVRNRLRAHQSTAKLRAGHEPITRGGLPKSTREREKKKKKTRESERGVASDEERSHFTDGSTHRGDRMLPKTRSNHVSKQSRKFVPDERANRNSHKLPQTLSAVHNATEFAHKHL